MRGTLPVIHWHESAAGQRLLHPRSYGLIFTTAHLTWCSVRRALWSDFMLRMESWPLTDESNRNLHLHFNLQVTSVDCFPSRNRMINLPTKRSICNQTEPIWAGKHGSVGLTKVCLFCRVSDALNWSDRTVSSSAASSIVYSYVPCGLLT